MERKSAKKTNYSFLPRNEKTIEKIQNMCKESEEWNVFADEMLSKGVLYEAKNINTKDRVIIYKPKGHEKTGTVAFSGKYNPGAEFYKFDLEQSVENIVAGNEKSPMLKELNFDYCVLGSDEVGNGEMFKPIIVTAAYVDKNKIGELIELNVKDSKKIKYENTLNKLGEELSGIISFDEIQNETVISTEYVTYCTKLLTNEEFNRIQREQEKDEKAILKSFHISVLNQLLKECKADYLIVDDFMHVDCKDEQKQNEQNMKYDEFREEISGIEPEKIFFRTQADGLNLAVACASVISSYFLNLTINEFNRQIQERYEKSDFKLPLGTDYTKKEFFKPFEMIDADDLEELMNTYAKLGFKVDGEDMSIADLIMKNNSGKE